MAHPIDPPDRPPPPEPDGAGREGPEPDGSAPAPEPAEAMPTEDAQAGGTPSDGPPPEGAPPGPPPTADAPDPLTSAGEGEDASPALSFRERAGRFWVRHRTLFWMLHSFWALATGVAVVLLARERYAFVPWVVAFLGLTWASTLFFGRSAEHEAAEGTADPRTTPGLAREVTSYVTRSLYQETLFFLLPFYAYSTVVSSVNVAFLVLLGGLALLSCLDLLFDRWLRTRPVFGMVFFATVSFAALNLLLPMLFSLAPRVATPVAALVAVGSAAPLALRAGPVSRRGQLGMGLAGTALLVVALGIPALVPPVPLRMQSATFAADIDRETLALSDTLGASVAASALAGRIVIHVEVFAPGSVPTRVHMEWTRDGVPIRTSRDVDILAHEGRFRVWDALRPGDGTILPGRYRVTLRTSTGRIFGVASLYVR